MFRTLLLSLTLVGCSVAPFHGPKSAQSLGVGHTEVEAGLDPAPFAAISHGVTDDWDIGVGLELQAGYLFSAFSKYSLLNNDEGLALAFYGGVFSAIDLTHTKGIFLGPVVSYQKGWFEVGASLRYNRVWWDLDPSDWGDDDFFELDPSTATFGYFQLMANMNFWVTDYAALSLYAHGFMGGRGVSSTILPGASLLFNF